MTGKRDKLNDLSVQELEQLLKIKQREARKERFLRMSAGGATKNAALLGPDDFPVREAAAVVPKASNAGLLQTPRVYALNQSTEAQPKVKTWRDRALTVIEVAALAGLIFVLYASYQNLQTLNKEVVEARALPSAVAAQPAALAQPTATLGFDRLPGGHTSPTSAGGASPDIPAHLQNWVQPAPIVPAPQQAAAQATRLVIPKINVDAPIINGVTWEDLKKGVGHLPGSAQPGERGNLYLAAHNDIFGEIFRHLDALEPGDEYDIYAGEAKFTYVVREKRIIDPTDVDVLLPTTEPVATLQTCYPYLIDSHRLVIIGDLVE